jgi:hypothetical protein
MNNYPKFPAFKFIEISDKEFICDILEKYQPETSELTFASFFIWRNFHKFYWSIWNNFLLSYCEKNNQIYAYEPIGTEKRDKAVRTILEYLHQEKCQYEPCIERADKKLVEEIKDIPDFQIKSLREHFDYLYSTEDLINLPGRKYHKKRNLIAKFLKTYQFRYEEINSGNIKKCLEFIENWCSIKECETNPSLFEEKNAVIEALNNFEFLNLKGCILIIDNNIQGFSIGERLNKETAVIHIEKANPEIPGLYTLINREFVKNTWSDTKYINREEDLGNTGLRQAKKSYYPIRLVEKFRIKISSISNTSQ